MSTRDELYDTAPAITAHKRRPPAGGQPSPGGGAVCDGAVGRAVVWPAILVHLALRRLEA